MDVNLSSIEPITSTVALQDDDKCCFYRSFLSIPNGPRIFLKLCKPMFYIDGAFSKTPEYDGTILTLVALNGNSAVIPLVVGSVPTKTTNHMAWFIQMCIKAGYAMEEYPIMTDCRNLLAASRALKEEFNLTLNLKFCLEHVIRNLVSMFDLDKDDEAIYLSAVKRIQQSSYLTNLTENFDKLVNSFDNIVGCGMEIYLLSIDPVHWIVYANKDICDNDGLKAWRKNMLRHYIARFEDVDPDLVRESVLESYTYSPVPVGEGKALIFWNHSNPIESSWSNGIQRKTIAITYRDLMPDALMIKAWVMRTSLVLLREFSEFRDLYLNSHQPWSNVGVSLLNSVIESTTKYKYAGTTTENDIVYHYVTHIAMYQSINTSTDRWGKKLLSLYRTVDVPFHLSTH
jgi:hypothetical protein